MRKRSVWVVSALMIMLASGTGPIALIEAAVGAMAEGPTGEETDLWQDFAADLETVRQALKIPGMSAAVVRGQELVWAQGFGYADLEKGVPATPDTPFGLASVTKPVAAVLIMQLVEDGVIDLDAPVSDYGVRVQSQGVVTVRHLLTHTSEGVPGTAHHYNGSRYAALGGVIEGATGRTFAELLSEKLLVPLQMQNTALNPINSWGGSSLRGLDDFKRALGWGAGPADNADVYRRLARPYQFDEAYEIIPGMYHLYHNPAAGLVSSVTDLARFDIALDRGQLLGETVKEAMFAPAYSTHGDRQDLQYGLGWYVQDFDGLRLLWHTGRWPPSTSALYLKVPEENLTLIVLANTDNLTVPFYGIGRGDVTQSTLALTFFRHFIFPRQHGTPLPAVDWQADAPELIEQLTAVPDGPARGFLERELWSYRQAYASAGRTELVANLERVAVPAFPRSDLRYDEFYTATAGPVQVVRPLLSAAALVGVARGMAVWFGLVIVSVLWMAIRLVQAGDRSGWRNAMWTLATLILGPLAVGVHGLVRRKRGSAPLTAWRQAAGSALFSITAYTIAWGLAISILMGLPGEPHPLLLLGLFYLTPLVLGLLVVRGPSLARAGRAGFGSALRRVVAAEIATVNLGFAVLFPLTMMVQQRVLSTIPHPTSPFFWGMMAPMAMAGWLVLFPLHSWMARREIGVRPASTVTSESVPDSAMLGSWRPLLATSGVMVATLILAVSRAG
jgi:CubicO group peptidase (beta-lactamase class C family)